MTKLSVNINKLALLRNSRGKNLPSVTDWARKILHFGAHGITVHPRPDGRHIRPADVVELQQLVLQVQQELKRPDIELNVEGFPSEDFLSLIEQVRPNQVTLVPDPPQALTSQAGWHFASHAATLLPAVERLKSLGIRVSLFLEPLAMDNWEWDALASIKPDRVELFTEAYHDSYGSSQGEEILSLYHDSATRAQSQGLGVNAGHDLNQINLPPLIDNIPWIAEVSIGHALICESLSEGMETTVRHYLDILKSPGTHIAHNR